VIDLPAARRLLRQASDESGIPVETLLGRSRNADVCRVRQIVMEHLDELGWSSVQIGAFFGRSHSNVLHLLGKTMRSHGLDLWSSAERKRARREAAAMRNGRAA
jgi:chromosomal replication initiation ATPase DnaA